MLRDTFAEAGNMTQSTTARQRVLVVDDEKDICEAIEMLLTLDGFEVVTASNGVEALNLYGTAKFDLVITDYSMPAMKGDALASAIKFKNPAQPIIMVTAYVEQLTQTETPLPGIDALLSKPFKLEQLRSTVAEVLRR